MSSLLILSLPYLVKIVYKSPKNGIMDIEKM